MGVSDKISIIAVLIAVLSAIYSRWAVYEAKTANRISKHERQLEIYNSFCELRLAMLQKATGINYADTANFYKPSKISELYFHKNTVSKLSEYFEVCYGLADLNRKYSRPNVSKDEIEKIQNQQDLLLSKEDVLSREIDPLLKKEMNIV